MLDLVRATQVEGEVRKDIYSEMRSPYFPAVYFVYQHIRRLDSGVYRISGLTRLPIIFLGPTILFITGLEFKDDDLYSVICNLCVGPSSRFQG